jgi:hypothetical protein
MALDHLLLFNFIELNAQDSACTININQTYLKSTSQLLVALYSNKLTMKRGIEPIIPTVEKQLAHTQLNKLLVPKKVAQP